MKERSISQLDQMQSYCILRSIQDKRVDHHLLSNWNRMANRISYVVHQKGMKQIPDGVWERLSGNSKQS